MEVVIPFCRCPDPCPVPVGYARTYEAWICDEGYFAPERVELLCSEGEADYLIIVIINIIIIIITIVIIIIIIIDSYY